jgi:hypothetical protein
MDTRHVTEDKAGVQAKERGHRTSQTYQRLILNLQPPELLKQPGLWFFCYSASNEHTQEEGAIGTA